MVSQERLKEVLEYNPETGFFWWKVGKRGAKKDRPAGTVDKLHGYIFITIDGVKYSAHRLAFLYMTGSWPEHTVDHWNTCRSDNVWDNIRDATHAQNLVNRGKMKSNTSGFIGVTADRGKWKAALKGKNLGRYNTPEEASEVYRKAALATYGDFAHDSIVRGH